MGPGRANGCNRDCFACDSGVCTALETVPDPCVFCRPKEENRREVLRCFYRLVINGRFDLIRKYRETLADLGLFTIELADADNQSKKLDRFRAENLEEMRRRYAAGEDVVLPADLIEDSGEDPEDLPEGEEDELTDNSLDGVVLPGDESAVFEVIRGEAETDTVLNAGSRTGDFLDVMLKQGNSILFNDILYTAGVSATGFEGDLSEETENQGGEEDEEESEQAEDETNLWDDEPDPEETLEERDRTPYVEDVLEKQTAWSGNKDLAGKPKSIWQEVMESQEAGKYWNPYSQAVRVRKIDPVDACYQLLAAAVIYKAVEDYVLTLRELWSGKGDRVSLVVDQITLESFFGSHWYWQLTSLAPEHVLDRCREMAEENEKAAIEWKNRFIVEEEAGWDDDLS